MPAKGQRQGWQKHAVKEYTKYIEEAREKERLFNQDNLAEYPEFLDPDELSNEDVGIWGQ